MRKLIFLFILLSTLLANCGKDSGTDDPNDPKGNGGEQTTLTISPNELTFKSEGEEKTFSITSNSDWIITNPSTWCKINPTQGNGNSTITAIADPSEEYDDRNFNLTIKAGETTKVMTVTQKKKDAIILTKEKYDIPTEGDNITVEVKSNISYSTIIPEEHNEWIKQIETKQLGRGLETKNLNFEISANPTTDKREGIIIIKDNSSSLADTIHVYQAQKDELILTQDTYNVSSKGENINVELRSNVDYEVIIPEDVKDWVNRITSRSSRVDNLIFNIAANPTYDNRSAKVIIKDKNSELADTLNINQTQVNAIILTQEKYEIPSEGQNIKIEVKSNIKYDIIIPDNAKEWIKQIQSRALITNIINLSISENTSYEQRAAEIVVKDKNSNLSDTIRITQKQNNIIILTQKKYDIPAEGQQISIEIKSNIEYDILLSTDTEKWIEKIDLSRALITNTLNYNILPNTTYNERKAEIIIKDKGSDLSDTVKIIQNPMIPTMDEIILTIKVNRNDIFSPFSSPEYFNDDKEKKEKYGAYHKIPQDWEVKWGDGQTTNSTTHQYKLEGIYQVIIKGTGITSIWSDEKCKNMIEEIDVTKAPNLVILGILYQNLKTLDLSKNTALRFLECEYNELSSLDLSKNIALESLQCMANNITSLDLSKNIVLTFLECCGNKITTLDLSKSSELIYLDCGENQLSSLDLSTNTEIVELYCTDNPFTQESVNNLLNSLPMGKYDNGKSISTLWIDDKWDISIAEEKGWKINSYF